MWKEEGGRSQERQNTYVYSNAYIFKSIKDMAKISTYLESTLNFVLEMKYFESFIIFLEKINFVRGFRPALVLRSLLIT